MVYAIITAVAAFLTALASGILSLWSVLHTERVRHAHEEMHRLGGATGALRFQLFLSTRSVVRRLGQYYNHRPDRPFPLSTERDGTPEAEYHAAGLLIFRLMRPLTLSHLIERETFAGDWLLDPNMVNVQRFNHAAFEMLTGSMLGAEFREGDVFDDFRDTSCWDPPDRSPQQGRQILPFQRVRASYLRTAAAALVVSEPERGPARRCMGHDEFLLAWQRPDENASFHEALRPVKEVIDGFNSTKNPVFWLRLVGYAYACKWFHDGVVEKSASPAGVLWRRPPPVKYTHEDLQVVDMLKAAESPYIHDNVNAYEKRFQVIIDTAL